MKSDKNIHIQNELLNKNIINKEGKNNNKNNDNIGNKNNIDKKVIGNNKNNAKDEKIYAKKKHRQKSRNKIKNEESPEANNSSIKQTKKVEKIKNRNISQTRTKDSATLNSASSLKETQLTNEDKNVFNFKQSLWNIIFLKTIKNNKGENIKIYDGDMNNKNLRRNIMNNKIKTVYNLLIIHMKYLKEKVLLQKGKFYFFETIEFYLKKFKEIENYIINCIILIKLFLDLGDPISLIKANQTLVYLAKELLDYNPNGGLLVFTINIILKKCMNLLKIRKYYRSIHIPYEIIKKYLLLISALIKFSSILNIPRLYYKFLNHYAQIYEVALFLLTQQHLPEKILLKSNLLFNTGCFLMQKNFAKSAMNLFKEAINIQGELEHHNFIYYASYYNCSILYFVMGDMKNCEKFLETAFKITERAYLDINYTFLNSKRKLQDLNNFKCRLLLFNAEYNMENEKYLKAIENLKHIMKILETMYIKQRYNITKKKESKSPRTTRNSKNIMREGKYRTTSIRKKFEKMSYHFLFEIEYYENPLEKMIFREKIKSIVNGLFNAILFLQNEREMKLKTNDNPSNDEINLEVEMDNSRLNNNYEKKRNKSYNKKIEGFNNLIDKLEIEKKIGTLSDINNNARYKKNLDEENNKNEGKNEKTFIGEKKANMVLNFFKEEFVRKIQIINNDRNINNSKYFIILLANLSLKQIELLNDCQNNNAPIETFYNLPIFFSSQFKNSLNQAQKNIFNKINFLTLIRWKILANPNKKISLNNINLKIFHSIKMLTNLKLKNYSDITNKIRKILLLKTNKNNIYINNKNYNLINQEDSYDTDECVNNEVKNKKIEFKYKSIINFENFKNEIINEINKSSSLYSPDKVDKMILIVKSEIFLGIMNGLELADIKVLKKDKSLLIEILNNEIKNIKKSQLNQMDSGN